MIDWGRLKDLRSEIGEADFADVIEMFLEETNEVIERLGQGPDVKQIEADLHFLKGSALNLGFAEVAHLCQAGERAAANGQAATINLKTLIASYAASRSQLITGLRPDSAA